MDNKLYKSFLSLAVVFFLFLSVTFAWFTIASKSRMEEMAIQVNNYDTTIILQVRKNAGVLTTITTKAELDAFFDNAIPNDTFYFKITIINDSTNEVSAYVKLNKITSSNENAGFDMTDVFYLVDGKVTINTVENIIAKKSEETKVLYGQELNPYRFSNIINDFHDLELIPNVSLEQNETRVIEFTVAYDYQTENVGYQEGIFSIDSIYVKFN